MVRSIARLPAWLTDFFPFVVFMVLVVDGGRTSNSSILALAAALALLSPPIAGLARIVVKEESVG